MIVATSAEQFKKDKKSATRVATEHPIGARMPEEIQLRDYQQAAVAAWAGSNYRGIFSMCTGAGKTISGLAAVAKLSQDLNDCLATIIVCPYQHLVEQWVEDIVKFNIKPIIGYSSSSQKDWKKRLEKAIRDQRMIPKKSFFCLVCTNATFSSAFVQEQIDKIKAPILLMVDEAHNFGAQRIRKLLDDRFTYRLALSATMDRHRDEEGTAALYNFFGKKCIDYTLEQAIRDGKLTPYKYYPVVVYLSDDELEKYSEISSDMAKHIIQGRSGNAKLDSYGEMLAIKRSRVVAGAIAKISELRKQIEPYKNQNNILVYCGATNILDEKSDDSDVDSGDIKQIDAVTQMFQAFNAGSSSFFSKSLIYRAMQVLQDETIPSADIPYMHVKTIEYLLRQKKCICGTHLDEGTVPYENVKALMDYLPPQSISTTVSQFKKDAKTRISALNRTNIPDAVSASYTFISDDDDTITDKEDELRRLESKMASSDDITVAVRKLETEIQQCKKSISTQTSTIARLTSEQDSLISTRDRAEKDRRELSLKDDKNRLIEVCRLYAGEIYNQLTSTYQASEKEVRDKLQATINSIFNDIYDGGLELSIDEKYHITVTVTGFGDDNVETSTAQSISVIFAFIAGIIKMARENKNASSENLRMLESEPYPLVMDAPLSAFDKKRIEAVCKALPDVAEQVIIFIKDTDGDLAEKYMSDKIGSRHHFEKIDEFETHLV